MKYKHNVSGHLMILPCYIIYLLFILLPVLMTVWYSFREYDLFTHSTFIGLNNFIRLFSDPIFLVSVKNTFIYAIGTIIPQITIGLLLAVILNGNIPGKGFFRLAFYIPYLVSMVSVAMLWLWIYDPATGVLNRFIEFIGLKPQRWLFDMKLALKSLMFMGIWKMSGYNMIIYLAGLQQIPQQFYEAADIDGINNFRKFFHITIPLIQPTTFFLVVINTIQSFAVFEQVNIMTDGGPSNATTTIVHQIFERGFVDFQMGYASSMGVLLLFITIILTMVNFKYGREGQDLS